MRREDLVVTAATAAVTALAWLMVCAPGSAIATGPVDQLPPLVHQPTLKVKGCEVTVQPAQAGYRAGEAIALDLHARNTTSQPVELNLIVSMWQSRGPEDLVARVIVPPRALWSQPCKLRLEPYGSATLRNATGVAGQPGRTLSVTVEEGALSVQAAEIRAPRVSAPAPAPAARAVPPARPGKTTIRL